MSKISVTTLPTSIDEAGTFEVSNKLSHFLWHEITGGYCGASLFTVQRIFIQHSKEAAHSVRQKFTAKFGTYQSPCRRGNRGGS
jgi:hypothetical protein